MVKIMNNHITGLAHADVLARAEFAMKEYRKQSQLRGRALNPVNVYRWQNIITRRLIENVTHPALRNETIWFPDANGPVSSPWETLEQLEASCKQLGLIVSIETAEAQTTREMAKAAKQEAGRQKQAMSRAN
jgi:hypothetical protein